MGYLGRPGTPFWSGHLGRAGTKIGPWAGPRLSAKHETQGSPARWHDGPNLARHDQAGPGPGWAARLLIHSGNATLFILESDMMYSIRELFFSFPFDFFYFLIMLIIFVFLYKTGIRGWIVYF